MEALESILRQISSDESSEHVKCTGKLSVSLPRTSKKRISAPKRMANPFRYSTHESNIHPNCINFMLT